MSAAFEDWRRRAQEADILEEAVARGAALKRTGREHVGPCPACGGKDRFSINPAKAIFNCRGAVGGDVIAMVMHLDGVSFTEACEALTSEPPPNGQAKPLSPAEQIERERARRENQARAAARAAQEAEYREDTRETAAAIWDASQALAGTLGATYLERRGIRLEEWPECLRFHPALPYPGAGRLPALVCRVEDLAGEFTAVWRIFLDAWGGKPLDLPSPKLGLGPAAGGAVRIGGTGRKIAVAEGVESALGYWLMTGRKHPCWAALSTSGMVGFEAPLGVEHVIVVPDGDKPIRRQGEEFVPAEPPGRKAALALRTRLLSEGIAVTIAAEPPSGLDYLNLWQQMQGEMA